MRNSKKLLYVLLPLLLVLSIAAYYKFDFTSSDTSANANAKAPAGSEQNKMPDLPPLDKNLKELKVTKLKSGEGREIKKGDVAYVIYAGFLPGGELFDSNVQSGQAIGFPIGEGAVIAGWDKALLGAREGDELLIDIPSSLAYGEKGVEGRIPPNSPLRFDVLIVKVMSKEELKQMQEQQKQNEAAGATTSEKSAQDSKNEQ